MFQGTFLVTQAVSQEMIDHRTKEGAIVNIASIVGKVRQIKSSIKKYK